jgi:hypothetical protein
VLLFPIPRIIGLRIANTGDVDILQNHFDQVQPWGLRLDDGQIIEVRLTGASSEYLDQNIRPTVNPPDTVLFHKVILERGKGITLELLVLHPAESQPTVSVLGKIAGIDSLTVSRTPIDPSEQSFLASSFEGGFPIQLVRLVGYFFGVVLIGVLIGFPVAWVSGFFQKRLSRARSRWAQNYLGPTLRKNTPLEVLAQVYEQRGKSGLVDLRRALASQTILRHAVEPEPGVVDIRLPGIELGPDGGLLSFDPDKPSGITYLRSVRQADIDRLRAFGVLSSTDDGGVEVDSGLLEVLDGMLEALGASTPKV